MNASNPSLPSGRGPARPTAATTTPPPRRRVVDLPTRLFHGLFALAFAGAYLTGDGERWRLLHVTLGYTMLGLLAWRVADGLWGPRGNALGLMAARLRALGGWLRRSGWWQGWRQGLQLMLAASPGALLLLALPLGLTGFVTYQEWVGEWMAELHELAGNAMLMVVLAHLGLVLGLSLLRRRNLAAPMFTGMAPGPGPDTAPKPRRALAAVMLLAVLGFAGWQQWSSPQGLMPAAGAADLAEEGRDDDDD